VAFTERYVTAAAGGGGDGSVGTPWTLAESMGASGAVAGDRVNVLKGAYSLGATTVSGAGNVADLVVWRGYNSTIGDLDDQRRTAAGLIDTTNFPVVTLTGILQPVTKNCFQNISFTGSLSSTLLGNTVTDDWTMISCSVLNTANNANAKAVVCDNNFTAINCDMECSGASHNTVVECDAVSVIYGSRFKGVANAKLLDTLYGTVSQCVFIGNATGTGVGGVSLAVGGITVINSTFYSLATAIELPNAADAQMAILINNHITDCSKYIDNLYSATSDRAVIESFNRTRDNTTPRTGVGDGVLIGEVTTDTGSASTDFVSAGTDFRLIAAAPARGTGMIPGSDIGGVQRVENLPAVTDVKNGVTYGGAGTDYTGTYTAAGGGGLLILNSGVVR
jgi:hypothetical protein